MIFCGTSINPGEKKHISIPVAESLSLEAVCFCGSRPGATLTVTAGVHGCEYVGIQALRELSGELEPGVMSGNVILLPVANPSAFYAGSKQTVPEDGVNLNRAFPGDAAGSLAFRLAHVLEKASILSPTFSLTFTAGTATSPSALSSSFPQPGMRLSARRHVKLRKPLTSPTASAPQQKTAFTAMPSRRGFPPC